MAKSKPGVPADAPLHLRLTAKDRRALPKLKMPKPGKKSTHVLARKGDA